MRQTSDSKDSISAPCSAKSAALSATISTVRRSGIKTIPKKKPTEAIPFQFATESRAKAKTERNNLVAEPTQNSDTVSKVVANDIAPLGKKRSALFERQQVVKKSISNLSMRSQYSGKIDIGGSDQLQRQARQPQDLTKRGSLMSSMFKQEKTDLKSSNDGTHHELQSKSSRRSFFSSLSFSRSKISLRNVSSMADIPSKGESQRLAHQKTQSRQQQQISNSTQAQTPQRSAGVYGLPAQKTLMTATKRLSTAFSVSSGSTHSRSGSRSNPASMIATTFSGELQSQHEAHRANSTLATDERQSEGHSAQAEVSAIVTYLQNTNISGPPETTPLADLQKLRQAASEQGRQTVEIWAASRQSRRATMEVKPVLV